MIPQQMIQFDQMQGMPVSSARNQAGGKGGGGGFQSILNNILNGKSGLDAVGNAVFMDKDSGQENKTGLIDFLRKFALSKGGNLEDMVVDENALSDLKKFLAGAGFDKNSIDSIFKNLRSKSGGRELTLSDIFKSLKGLSREASSEENGNFLPISMVPYLETALSSFGLRSSEISEALSGAKREGVGIDLNSLVTNLKSIQARRQLPINGTSFDRSPGTFQELSPDENLKVIFNQIGNSDLAGKGKITLSDFIKGLEGFLNRGQMDGTNIDALNADLKKFFDKVKIDKNSTLKSRSFGLNSEIFKSNLMKGSDGKSGILNPSASDDPNLMADKGMKDSFMNAQNLQKNGFSSALSGKNSLGNLTLLKNGNMVSVTSEDLKGATKKAEDGSFSFDNIIREINNPDKQIFTAKEPVPQRNLPAYVLNQVGRQIFRSVQNGDTEVKFQIRPPHLGRLQMTIDNSPDGFKISIIAEQNAAKDLILSQSHELKAAMMEQGIRIDAIDVNVSSDFQQAMTDARQQEENTKKRGGNKESQKEDEINLNGILEGGLSTGPLWYRAGILDLVA